VLLFEGLESKDLRRRKFMSKFGKLNLLAMIAVPVTVAVSSLIIFGTRFDTMSYLFGLNLAVVLIPGFFSWLMLRKANNDISSWVAISPTLIPGAWLVLWYAFRTVSPAAVAPGAEYIAAPQYYAMLSLLLVVVTFIAGFFVRSR